MNASRPWTPSSWRASSDKIGNPRALKITVIERILWVWVLTIPAAGGIAYSLLRLLEALGWA